jgi:hypothetical protein
MPGHLLLETHSTIEPLGVNSLDDLLLRLDADEFAGL